GDIDAFVDDVDAAVADVQLHAHLRVLGQEFRQQLRHLLLRHSHRHAHADHAARFRAEAVDDFARGLCLGQHRLRMAVNTVPDFGHGEAARRTLQQAHAQVGLELADAAAQARLGDTQRAFRGGETLMVDHGGEVIEVVEVLHGDYPAIRTVSDIKPALSYLCNGGKYAPTRPRPYPLGEVP